MREPFHPSQKKKKKNPKKKKQELNTTNRNAKPHWKLYPALPVDLEIINIPEGLGRNLPTC